MSEPTRAYIYRLVLMALALLTFYGVISGEEAAAWADAAIAILGLSAAGLAVRNTSTKR